MKEIIISPLEEGQRLDRVLGRFFPRASMGFLYKMLRKKNITLNGKRAEGNEKLSRGDVIRIYFAEETLEKFMAPPKETLEKSMTFPKETGPALFMPDIVYEDEQILLVNKPAGVLSQKADPRDISLNESVIGYLLSSGFITQESLLSFRPSVCNRLDRNTSGIVAVGKTTAALQELSEMLRERTIHKYYQALVIGRVEEGRTIDAYLVKDRRKNQVVIRTVSEDDRFPKDEDGNRAVTGNRAADGNRAVTGNHAAIGNQVATGNRAVPESVRKASDNDLTDQGQRIRTKFEPIAYRTDGDTQHELTLLDIELITGRSHQIRAHLASIGHSVVGDPKYGNKKKNAYFEREYGLHAQLLHAGRIAFTKKEGALGYLCGREFSAPLPELFERILKKENIRYGNMEFTRAAGQHPGGPDQPHK